MKSIVLEIMKLRNGKRPMIDYRNSNRYCIVVSEDNGTKTTYCFGVPIYNKKTRKLVDLRFHEINETWKSYGSTAETTVGSDLCIENGEGSCRVLLPGEILSGTEASVMYGAAEIVPTLNGVCVRVPCSTHQPYDVTIIPRQPFMNVRGNDRYFSLMSEKFRPFVTVSCIGVTDGSGQVIAPCSLEYQKNNDNEFALSIRHTSPYGSYILFEVNLHEAKLFQDTTVESLHPDTNNAFGTTAFLGKTAAYGEQWLYSRADFALLPELADKQIIRATMHLPWHGGHSELTSFGLTTRFCSFGSNWDNKIAAADELSDTYEINGYHSLNITSLLIDRSRFLKPSEGFILKPKMKGNSFCAIATGDSSYSPQILEVNYR